MSERMCKDCFFNRNMQCGITGDCTVGHECYATPADFARVRRELSAVDPVTAGLERMARAYGRRLEAQREAFIVLNSRESTGKQKDTATGPVWDAKGEEDKAWKALLDAGWTGEESEEEEESDG